MIAALLSTFLMSTSESFVAPGAQVEQIPGTYRFTEGPVWTKRNTLIFSDIPANKLYEVNGKEVSVYRDPSRNANGHTIDHEGNLYTCEHGSRTVTVTLKDGTVKTIADSYDGKKLNSPNDIAIHPEGWVFFTDPSYGIRAEQQEQPARYVFWLDPATLKPEVFATGRAQPNGLVFSLDGSKLYLADSEAGGIEVYPAGLTKGAQPIAKWEAPGPDGLRLDTAGNVWAACGDGVRVYSPAGELLETIKFPQQPANLCFGEDGKTLFVTARTGVYKLRLRIKGIMPGFPRD